MHSVKLLFRLLRIQIRSQLQYPTSFIFEVIGGAFIMGTFFISFALALSQFENIGGWTLGEVAFVWGITEFSFGAMV